MTTIRNPIEWSADSLKVAGSAFSTAMRYPAVEAERKPQVAHIGLADLQIALRQGWEDFKAYRTDVLFLCLIYPLAGLAVATLTFNYNLLPLLFPAVSGFALLGPFAAAGLYEMSRRREHGDTVAWMDAFDVFASPSIGAILKLALLMTGLFVLWLTAAMAIYRGIFADMVPASLPSFVNEVLTTSSGWALIFVGGAVGFLFALVALSLSVVSFPLLLDRQVGVATAVRTSVRAVTENPVPMLAWGLIVAGGLVLGAVPALLGFIVIMPVLGHATWHLYRRVVV